METLKAIGNSADPENMREYEQAAIDAYCYIKQLEESLKESERRASDLSWYIDFSRTMGVGR